jgi:hypothetical protein
MRSIYFSGIGLFVCVFLLGCTEGETERVPISGKITLDNQPIDGGTILFLPQEKGKIKTGATIEEGQYILDEDEGPQAGQHRVEIYWAKKTGRQIPSNDPPNMMDETREVVPGKYNQQSVLTVEIKPGENTFDLDLRTR